MCITKTRVRLQLLCWLAKVRRNIRTTCCQPMNLTQSNDRLTRHRTDHLIAPSQTIAGSATRELHDACLVFRTDLGQRKCTFTGDASDANLNWIAQSTTHICDDILHASHHGSMNGADLEFIKACKAQFTVISTESGVYENVPDGTALARYQKNSTQGVYRTDRDGIIEWNF
jgi:beta-lactamase superfamily II metal-dependent hydrolase